ncbi:hypothetical protein [Streptomyces griseocarneus]|uniref:hypothetical protein n=1 Tax=Streptomyces griseocarneus TaxID=51201 RepID=UPI001CCDF62E|nr:hypothetical protein [Streptomyces griseocarneus]MBZ6476249.1 hypothetical protein [Streptomyces griseocarneus]
MTALPARPDDTATGLPRCRGKAPTLLDALRIPHPVAPPQMEDAQDGLLSVLPDGTVIIGQVSADFARKAAPNNTEGFSHPLQQCVLDGLLTHAAILRGDTGLQARLDQFATRILRLRTGERWREALSTALLGAWVAPLAQERRLLTDASGGLRPEVRTIHRPLVPLWRRRAGGLSRDGHRVERRVLLQETPCAEGLTCGTSSPKAPARATRCWTWSPAMPASPAS